MKYYVQIEVDTNEFFYATGEGMFTINTPPLIFACTRISPCVFIRFFILVLVFVFSFVEVLVSDNVQDLWFTHVPLMEKQGLFIFNHIEFFFAVICLIVALDSVKSVRDDCNQKVEHQNYDQ